MGPRNAYKDMLDNVVSPIACVSINHQNQLEQMANGSMFATQLQICSSLSAIVWSLRMNGSRKKKEEDRIVQC
jgi:hypothetical protein